MLLSSFFLRGGPGFYIRQPERTDYPTIAYWMALKTGLSGADMKHTEAMFLAALLEMAEICGDYCVVGVYDGKPIFFLEMAGLGKVCLTMAPEADCI